MSSRHTDYFMWFLVLTVSITIANVASHLIIAEVTKRQALAEIAAINDQQQQQAAEYSRQARAQRARSQTGKALETQCQEWQVTHRRYPSFTSQTEMKKHCDRLEQFLSTGGVSP